jgi:hypothetical protein
MRGALPFANDRPLRMQFYDCLHLHVAVGLLIAQVCRHAIVHEAVLSSRQGSTHAISECVSFVCLGISLGLVSLVIVVGTYFLPDKLTAPRYRSFFASCSTRADLRFECSIAAESVVPA